MMRKVLISLPDQLVSRMQGVIPIRQRSKIIMHLIEAEIQNREDVLYQCALAVEKDHALRQEMDEWNVTLHDGLNENKKIVPTRKAKKRS